MLKTLWIAPVAVLGFIGSSTAGDKNDQFPICRAQLDGLGQVPPVNTDGTATFKVKINHDGSISYQLRYSDLSGDDPTMPSNPGKVIFADVHFGPPQNTGGILFFMCANQATAPSQGVPPQTPTDSLGGPIKGAVGANATIPIPTTKNGQGTPCPDTSTTSPLKGTITAASAATDIVGAPVQGIAKGDLAAVVEAFKSGFTYAQVHTMNFPGGEVRGQIEVEGERENER